jgi:hypothetical protein
MKYITCNLFLFCSLLTTSSACAQFYVKTGFIFSDINSEHIETDGMGRMMIGLGGFPVRINESLRLQTEITFTGKGFKYSNNKNKEQIKFYYFTAPVTVNYIPRPFFSLEGGLEIAGLIDAKFESRRFNDRIYVETYSNWDLGAVAGANFFENQIFNLSIRYIHGIRSILKYPAFDEFGNISGEINDVNNQTFQVVLRVILAENE